MSNKVLLDSSILIEYLKNNRVKLLNTLLEEPSFSGYINETIISEFYFHFLKLNTGRAPVTLQSLSKIKDVLDDNRNHLIINMFELLPNNQTIIRDVPHYMAKYNLLPNDAIILATCKSHNITKLASHDSDFILPCQAEGIELLTEQ